MNAVISETDELLGRYLALFSEFLEQSYAQECSLVSAVELLMGQGGVLRDALLQDMRRWHVTSFDIDREVRFMKGWIRARVGHVRRFVQDACEQNSRCVELRRSGRPQSCRTASEAQLAMLCRDAGIAPGVPTVCKQGSLEPRCVVDANPCAREPCQNGGRCDTTLLAASPSGLDACGCAPGEGWSGSEDGCADGKTTSLAEGRACMQRRAIRMGTSTEEEELEWLSFTCDCNGGWGGSTCERAGRVGPDACGCTLGTGWSKSQGACKPGGTTTPSEAAACGGGASGAECGLGALATLTGASCPAAGPGRVVPSTCPAGCAAAIVPWWRRCGGEAALAAEVGDAQVMAALNGFASQCSGGGGGGGHR